MSFNSHSISDGFKGRFDRLKTVKISTSDITDKLTSKVSTADIREKLATKITAAEITDKMKKLSETDFTEKMKKGVDQVTTYAKTVAEKIPAEKMTSKGVVNLNSNGYEVYNIEDSVEVYVASVPAKATFDDNEYILSRAKPDEFVGAEAEETVVEAPVSKIVPDVDSESLFANVIRGGTRDVPVTIGMYKDGTIEEHPDSTVDYDDDMNTIIIMPVEEDVPVMEMPVAEEIVVEAPVVAAMPSISKIEVEPLTTETVESSEMIGSADGFINAMAPEFATTSSTPEPLKVNPMNDDYSKDALTPVVEPKTSSRAPRFVFKDGKLQMVSPEDDSSAFTVNRSVCIEDEVSGIMKMTLPELELLDESFEDAPCEQMADDGMEAMPFPSKMHTGDTDGRKNESECGKVTFDFEKRSSDYGLIGFSF